MTTKPQSTTEPPERIRVCIRAGKEDWIGVAYAAETDNPSTVHEYTRVDRKYFCSCGAALTAEEYITHLFELGHDRGIGPAAPVVDNVGLNLLRQLVGGKNSLRTLGVFPCNQAEHEDVDCECFWEQCEAWARQDAGVTPANQLLCAKCGKPREGVSAESFLCRYCFSTESIAATAAPVEQSDETPSDVDRLLYRLAARDCERLAAGMNDCTEELPFADWCVVCQSRGLLQKYSRKSTTLGSSTSARAAAEEWFVMRGEKHPDAQPAIDQLAAIIERHCY